MLPEAKMSDPQRALLLYEQAWKQGVVLAGYRLGQLYERGAAAADGSPALPKDTARAWDWYQKASQVRQPDAVARFAERGEERALEANSRREQTVLLLDAFGLYARAVRTATAQKWPDEASRQWRYRRSSLARVLAGEGMMRDVAGAYRRVLEER
jgi:TPR repeat protein